MSKIAHIVCTFLPYKGGIGDTCYYQSRLLSEMGHDITIFTPRYNKTSLQVSGYKLRVHGLRPILKHGNAAWTPQIIKYLNNYDVIHLHWPFIGAEKAIWWWKIFNPRKKLIVQYQMDLVGRGIWRIIFAFYQAIFLPLIVRSADKIIISTKDYAQKSRLAKYLNRWPEKFITINLGVDINLFFPQDKDLSLLSQHGLSVDDNIILFVGGLDKAHYFKGLEQILYATKELVNHNLRLKLIVIGSGNLLIYYKNLANKLAISRQIVFTGRVSDEDLVKYFNLTDLFVLPSINQSESFGLVNLMAMACAKPIIISNLPGLRTLVIDGLNGYRVAPGDINDLADKISLCFQDKNRLKEMGQRGREIVIKHYNWNDIAKQINQLYQQILLLK